jgi:hypothetical protein
MKVSHLGECRPYEFASLFQVFDMNTAVGKAAPQAGVPKHLSNKGILRVSMRQAAIVCDKCINTAERMEMILFAKQSPDSSICTVGVP